jgi:hypothetical protein
MLDDMDEVDSSGIDFTADPVPDDDLPFVVLSPDGDPGRIEEYGQLFEGGS